MIKFIDLRESHLPRHALRALSRALEQLCLRSPPDQSVPRKVFLCSRSNIADRSMDPAHQTISLCGGDRLAKGGQLFIYARQEPRERDIRSSEIVLEDSPLQGVFSLE